MPDDQAAKGKRAGAIVTLALCGATMIGAMAAVLASMDQRDPPGLVLGRVVGLLVMAGALWFLLAGPAVRALKK